MLQNGKLIYLCSLNYKSIEPCIEILKTELPGYNFVSAYKPHNHSSAMIKQSGSKEKFCKDYTRKLQTLSFFLDMYDNCLNIYYPKILEGENIVFYDYYLTSICYGIALGTDTQFVTDLTDLLIIPDKIIYIELSEEQILKCNKVSYSEKQDINVIKEAKKNLENYFENYKGELKKIAYINNDIEMANILQDEIN